MDINWNPAPRELRLFAALLVVFSGIVAGLAYHNTSQVWLAAAIVVAAGIVGAAGLIRPAWMRPIYVAWMVAAFPIGWVISHLLLAAVFYLLFAPIGLLLRLAGKDPLQRRFDPAAETYWIPRKSDNSPQRYFRQH